MKKVLFVVNIVNKYSDITIVVCVVDMCVHLNKKI